MFYNYICNTSPKLVA